MADEPTQTTVPVNDDSGAAPTDMGGGFPSDPTAPAQGSAEETPVTPEPAAEETPAPGVPTAEIPSTDVPASDTTSNPGENTGNV